MAPPSGPRAGGAATSTRGKPQSRLGARGGSIQKRRAPGGRVDRDGDVSMDASSTNGAAGGASGRGGRGGAAKRATQGTRASSRIAQNVATYAQAELGKGDGGRTGRVSVGASKARFAHSATLKVHGLKDSKAASNSDGGVRTLLTFLERKASKGDKHIAIRKVCSSCEQFSQPLGPALDTPVHIERFGSTHPDTILTYSSLILPFSNYKTLLTSISRLLWTTSSSSKLAKTTWQIFSG
jgi:hypothetical protein